MPTYDYICKDCGDRFDHFQSMSSPPLTRREGCESKDCNVERVVSGGTGLIFKGSGFYLTDYKKNKKNKSNSESSTDSKTAKEKKIKLKNNITIESK